jgi:small-conductance mechanosensitive channel
MLEIIWIVFFAGRMARIAQDKGYKPGVYRFLAILLWLVPELIGFILAMLIIDSALGAYLIGLACAIIASLLLYLRLRALKDKMPAGMTSTTQLQWLCPQCGKRNTSWDQKCVDCGVPRPSPVVQSS